MSWTKAGVNGALAGVLMALFMQLALQGMLPLAAPFNVPPSAAFLSLLGLEVPYLALAIHLAYGVTWSVVHLWLFWDRTSVTNGLGLAVVLWLGMMLVLSPMLGWGAFGWTGTPGLSPDADLYLRGGVSFPIMTLLLHGLYGLVIGFLNRRWVQFGSGVAQEIRQAAREDEI